MRVSGFHSDEGRRRVNQAGLSRGNPLIANRGMAMQITGLGRQDVVFQINSVGAATRVGWGMGGVHWRGPEGALDFSRMLAHSGHWSIRLVP